VTGNLVVLTCNGSLLAFEQPLDNGHRLSQPINPDCSTVKSEARLVVLRSNAAGAQAKFETSLRQEIHCRGFTRDKHRMAEVVVKNARADSKPFRRVGGTDQCRYRGDDVGEMIGNG
jgi:hypothetical protein